MLRRMVIASPLCLSLSLLGALACGQGAGGTASASASASGPAGSGSAAAPALPPATFQVALVNDELDPLAADPVAPKPLPPGASLFSEATPLGMKRVEVPKTLAKEMCGTGDVCIEEGGAFYIEQPNVVERHYLRFVKLEGEGLDATAARARKHLATAAPAEAGTFFLARAFEDPETPDAPAEVVGFRTLLVARDPVVRAADVAKASVEEARGAIVVMIELTPDAAARLETVTTKNVGRRLAVVVGDEVLMSPVIQGGIKGGRLPLGIGKVEEALTARPEAEIVLATILRAKG